jgi:hypothetical protein
VFFAQGFLSDFQAALEQGFGLLLLALGIIKLCQVVQADGDIGVFFAQGFLSDRQAALAQRFGLCVLA